MSTPAVKGPEVRVVSLLEALCRNCGEWVRTREGADKVACPRCSNVWSIKGAKRRLEVVR